MSWTVALVTVAIALGAGGTIAIGLLWNNMTMLERNFRVVTSLQTQTQEILAKVRLDMAQVIRDTWREAQACLLAESEGNVQRIEDYIARSDEALKGWEEDLHGNVPEHSRSRGAVEGPPENGPKLD